MVQVHRSNAFNSLRLGLTLLALFSPTVLSFSWRNEVRASAPLQSLHNRTEAQVPRGSMEQVYAVALNELKELESQPLCHRVAARLLVNNCQLLEGRDEATVHTDSGRQLRDFIDSYAASLAICDLERGSFNIPRECTKFREPALSQLEVRNEAYMHVTTKEIDLCLSALGVSDSAWNTWVSYRHKTFRFCEAARADNGKTSTIHLHQRLTKILSNLTTSIETELHSCLADLDARARLAAERIDRLNPHIDSLHDRLAAVQHYLARDVAQAAAASDTLVRSGAEHAANLEQMLAVLLRTVMDSNADLAAAHSESLSLVTRRASDELGAFVGVVASAAASSLALQNQIELSRHQADALAQRQEKLESNLDRLISASETLASHQAAHSHLLQQASNITSELLDGLESTASAATRIGKSVFDYTATQSNWWPYVVCPTVSLVMGSYGLPPSIVRNLGLVVVGEVFGFVVASFDDIRRTFGELGMCTVVAEDSGEGPDDGEGFGKSVFDGFNGTGMTGAGDI
ncbi:hypothetical protein GE09DRAFT_1187170 [Coniochaeta sp. 2T2.1]|nr:hypothetical protein GE09DRAFT_1187170 [Coniochaeta sp. 2T2.1]